MTTIAADARPFVPPATTPLQRRLWALQVRLAPYLFVSPFLALFCVFLAYPLVRSLTMSLQPDGRPASSTWAGLRQLLVPRRATPSCGSPR